MKPLKVKHKRKWHALRKIELWNSKICIMHQYDERLLSRLRHLFKRTATYNPDPDPLHCGFFTLELSRENALKVLKFGIENDYFFSEEIRLKFAERGFRNQRLRG